MTHSATIELPWPSRVLSQNARVHWARKASAGKAARTATRLECIAQGVPRNIGASRVVMGVVFLPPDSRRRDLDNCIGSLKFATDAIAAHIGVEPGTGL